MISVSGSGGFLPAMNNPFATEHVESVPFRFASGDWDSQLNRLTTLGFHAAVTGPKGTGKTTLLEQLVNHLRQRVDNPVIRICIERQRDAHSAVVSRLIDRKRDGAIGIVDGMERLSLANRFRLLASRHDRRGGLIVASHRRCRLSTWIQCVGDQNVLRYVLDRLRVEPDSELWHAAVEQLKSSGGNVREVLRYLYDQFASGRFVQPPVARPAAGEPPLTPVIQRVGRFIQSR